MYLDMIQHFPFLTKAEFAFFQDMVACDNVDCPYEWFHYPCVGISAPPKGIHEIILAVLIWYIHFSFNY